MGEAKRRGDRDQRVAQAIQAMKQRRTEDARRVAEAEAQREKRIAEQWNALPPKEKERRLEKAKKYAAALGGLMSGPGGCLLAAAGIVLAHPHTEYPPDIGIAGNGEVQS